MPKKVSRQRLWQIEQLAKGNCQRCGEKRDRWYQVDCAECREKSRKRYVKKKRLTAAQKSA